MAYEIYKSDGSFLVTVEDGTINSTKTTINLIGRAYPNYGDELNQNLVWMMENFSSSAAPSNPLRGQNWHNTSTGELSFWTGSDWEIIVSSSTGGSAYVRTSGDTMTGKLTIDTNAGGLDTYSGNDGLVSQGIRLVEETDVNRYIDFCTLSGSGLGRRWNIICTDETETGGDAGSNFAIGRWDDNDSKIDTVIEIERATGVTTFNHDIDMNNNKILNTGSPVGFVGEIKMVAISGTPDGWLECDGASYSTGTYSDLFSAIGYDYGGSGGSFNVPDLRGRFPVGEGDSGTTGSSSISRGDYGGTAKHTLIEDELASHGHTGSTSTDGSHRHGFRAARADSDAEGGNGDREPTDRDLQTDFAGNHSHTVTISDTGNDEPHENMPPYTGVRYIIYSGV